MTPEYRVALVYVERRSLRLKGCLPCPHEPAPASKQDASSAGGSAPTYPSCVNYHPSVWSVSVVRSRVRVQATTATSGVGFSPDPAFTPTSVGGASHSTHRPAGSQSRVLTEPQPRVSRQQETPQTVPARGSHMCLHPQSVPREPPARRSGPDPSPQSHQRSESLKAGGQ